MAQTRDPYTPSTGAEEAREKIYVHKLNEAFIKLGSDSGTAQEISDYFTFEVPGAKFMPAYRNKYWDGKIRLFNVNTRQIYAGLFHHLQQFCQERDYILEDVDDAYVLNDISTKEASQFFSSYPIQPRDYQIGAFVHAIRHSRAMILSPTASGKSLIIYMLCDFLPGRKLIIVPTTSLVTQMDGDFKDYSVNQHSYSTHLIMAGQDKNADADIFISTWQSIYKMPRKWFDQFDVVIGDEAHLFKSQSLTSIMTKLENCKYRYGFTGTLDGTQTHQLVLEGLFGSVMKVISTKELMDSDTVADLRIKGLVLKYPDATRKMMAKADYKDEIDFLISNEARNKFIKNLTLSQKGNTLVLYQMVEKHGQVLYDLINSSVDENRKVFFVHGKVDADEREEVRRITEGENGAIIIASYGTFSTGINIRNLHNIIFASPSKSRIRNLQSIGRGLRKGDNKESATLYDIADDLSWKKWHNYTLKHFAIRVKMYNEEEFNYKIYNIRINDVKSDKTNQRRNSSLFDN
jgi:superfamily II DNA or RNA helicase